jgi:DNA-binding HxlR family transcriptional regulator
MNNTLMLTRPKQKRPRLLISGLRLIQGISQKMLTQTLRQLEFHGLVVRLDRGTVPPHVEYEISQLGNSLNEIMVSFDDWFAVNLDRYDQLSSRSGA